MRGAACVAIGVWSAVWGAALAQEEVGPADADAVVDAPADVVSSLRRAYRERVPFVEEVRVTAGAGGLGRSGTVRVYADGAGRAAVELGPYIVNAFDGRIVMAHELDAQTYVEVADLTAIGEGADSERRPAERPWFENDAYAAMGVFLPPVNALALELVFGGDALLREPVPFARGVAWDRVERVGAAVTMRGRFEAGAVELRADAESWRVRSLRVRFTEGERLLVFRHRLSAEGDEVDRRRWVIDTGRRERLADASALRARPGDVVSGVVMPRLDVQDPGGVLGLTRREPGGVPRPGAVVVFDAGAAGVAGGAVRRLDDAGVETVAVAVVDVAAEAGSVRGALRGVWEALGRRSFVFSIDAERTLRRFTAEGACAVVAVGADGVVRGVYGFDADAQEELIERAVSRVVERLSGEAEGEADGGGGGAGEAGASDDMPAEENRPARSS